MSDTVKKRIGLGTSYGFAKSTGRLPEGMTADEYADFLADFVTAAQTAVDARDAARAAQSAAETAQGSAETAATQAAGSATTASGAASTATQKAGEASTYASNAGASASQAQTYASNAEQSATAASGSASAASGSASAAAGSASAASQSETNAASSASAAEQSAAAAAESARTLTIDTTLTQAGQAAEAKATGDELANLKSQIGEKAPAIMQTVTNQAIASFSDGADDMPLKSLTVAINPVQAGTGDPAPDNVRPISGWTGCHVYKFGGNLFDKSTVISGYYIDASGYRKTIANGYISDYIPVKPGVTLHHTELLASNLDRYIGFNDLAKNPIGAIKAVTAGQITVPDGAYYIRLSLSNTLIDSVVISPSPITDYKPYDGNTYDITFPTEVGTVYGGKLDVISGVLTVDWVYATYDGSEIWYSSTSESSDTKYFMHKVGELNTVPYGNYILCDKYKTVTIAGANTIGIGIVNSSGYRRSQIVFRPELVADMSTDDLKALLASDPITVCYKVTEGTQYHLTPTEVKTLLGQNNIFADTGNVTVIYPADTKMYIDGQIATLQALLLENISNS